MANKHVSDNHPVRWVRVDECAVLWPDAQRSRLHESTINQILSEFDPDLLGVVTLAEKNGKGLYHIIDGKHRQEALSRMGYGDQFIRAEVLDVHDAKRAAHIFRGRNASKKVPALDDFRTAVTEGAEPQTTINAIVQANGFRIGISDSPRAIAAVGVLKEIFKKFGGDVLSDTLQTVTATWRDDANAASAQILTGVGYFIGTYGSDVIDFPRLRARLGKKTPGNLIGAFKAQKDTLSCNLAKAALYVIVASYNTGLRSNNGKLALPEF